MKPKQVDVRKLWRRSATAGYMHWHCCSCHQWWTKDGMKGSAAAADRSVGRRFFSTMNFLPPHELKLGAVVVVGEQLAIIAHSPLSLGWSGRNSRAAERSARTHTHRPEKRKEEIGRRGSCQLAVWASERIMKLFYFWQTFDNEATSTSSLFNPGGVSAFVGVAGQTFEWDFQAVGFKAGHRTTWSSRRKGENPSLTDWIGIPCYWFRVSRTNERSKETCSQTPCSTQMSKVAKKQSIKALERKIWSYFGKAAQL